MNPKEVIAMNDDILHGTSSEEETIEPDTFFSEHEHEVEELPQTKQEAKQELPPIEEGEEEEKSEHEQSEGKKQRKSRKCKFQSTLLKLKTDVVLAKRKKDQDKIDEINLIRSVLKITDSKLEEFNRINHLIGRGTFDRDKYVKLKWGIEKDP